MATQPRRSPNMADQHQVSDVAPYGDFIEQDLIDDATGSTPMVGLSKPLALKDRFVRRLSKMLGAEANIREDANGNAMDIFLSRGGHATQPSVGLDEELRKFVRELEDALACVAKASIGLEDALTPAARESSVALLHRACEDLWDILLVYKYNSADQLIRHLQKTYKDNQNTFDHLAISLFGIDDPDDKGSMLDQELGDQIIRLSHYVRDYTGSTEEIKSLIQFASSMTRLFLDLRNRLKYILEKTRLAEKLYEAICQLGFPERLHSTLVRSARASQVFKNVTFHLRPNSLVKSVSFATPMARSTPPDTLKPSTPPQKEKSKRIQRWEAAATAPPTPPTPPSSPQLPPLPSSSSSSPSPPSLSSQSAAHSLGPLITAAQPYLARKDRNLPLIRLQPASKQKTAQLVGTILREGLLPVQTAAWYSFGFVTANKDEEQERQLAGLYVALLKEAKDPEAIFRELETALEQGKLVGLFDKYQYNHFRQQFPYLKTFLTTPPSKRSTVWRLHQFIQDPDDDVPPACLQRDYGFKFCRQREEVHRLKEIYKHMLRKLGPKKLDIACVNGRLVEAAMKEGVAVDVKDRRFLKNDYGSPFLGLDCGRGLEAYCGPFYKKGLKL